MFSRASREFNEKCDSFSKKQAVKCVDSLEPELLSCLVFCDESRDCIRNCECNLVFRKDYQFILIYNLIKILSIFKRSIGSSLKEHVPVIGIAKKGVSTVIHTNAKIW